MADSSELIFFHQPLVSRHGTRFLCWRSGGVRKAALGISNTPSDADELLFPTANFTRLAEVVLASVIKIRATMQMALELEMMRAVP